jgi:hypothetical protein
LRQRQRSDKSYPFSDRLPVPSRRRIHDPVDQGKPSILSQEIAMKRNQNLFAATLASAVIGGIALGPAYADDSDTATPARAGDAAVPERSVGERVDDATIVARVKSGLLASSEVEGLDVNVDARNGVVTLSGTADSMAERQSAERIARSADGVRGVDNKIVIKSEIGESTPSPSGPSSRPADPAAPSVPEADSSLD